MRARSSARRRCSSCASCSASCPVPAGLDAAQRPEPGDAALGRPGLGAPEEDGVNQAYIDGLRGILPEIALTVTALAVMVLDLLTRGRDSRRVGWLRARRPGRHRLAPVRPVGQQPAHRVRHGRGRRLRQLLQALHVAAVAGGERVPAVRSPRAKHGVGGVLPADAGAAIGIFFMVSTTNLLLLVLGWELLSLSSYSLAGFHKGDRRSARPR